MTPDVISDCPAIDHAEHQLNHRDHGDRLPEDGFNDLLSFPNIFLSHCTHTDVDKRSARLLSYRLHGNKNRKTHQISSKHTMVRKNQQIPTKLTQKLPRISYSLPTFPYENLGHLLTGTVASRLGEKAPGVLTGRHSFRTNILF